jgi:hypothetical protein
MTATLAQTYSDSYYYSYDSTYSSDAGIAFMIAMLPILLWTILITYAITAIFLGLIFRKAGVPAWKAWVPVYSTWTLLKLGGQNGIWAVLGLIPVVNYVSAVFMYIAMYYIGKNLGKSGTFVLWAIFLSPVWLVWLAVDNSTWKGAKPTRSSK